MLNKQFKELKSTKDTLTNNLNQLKQEIIDMNDLHSRKDAERMAEIAVLKNENERLLSQKEGVERANDELVRRCIVGNIKIFESCFISDV